MILVTAPQRNTLKVRRARMVVGQLFHTHALALSVRQAGRGIAERTGFAVSAESKHTRARAYVREPDRLVQLLVRHRH